jgi:4-hydroxy-2-oxoheptanedioate aldolase
MTTINPLLAAWKSPTTSLGGWCTLPGGLAAEVIARQDLDWVCIDQQHGMIDDSTAIDMLQGITAAGKPAIVRVRWNEAPAIMSALDAGAMGVIIPMIETAEDARRAVSACRYPPHGQRSYGPIRARDVFGSTDPDVLSQVACVVMIETPEALENLDEILDVPGIDGIYLGPSDLALSLGEKPGTTAKILETTMTMVAEKARARGIAVGIHTGHGSVAARYVAEGYDFVTCFSDAGMISAAVAHHLSLARESSVAASEPASGSY